MIDFVPVLLAAAPALAISAAAWVSNRKKHGKFSAWLSGEGYQVFLLAMILIAAVLYRVL